MKRQSNILENNSINPDRTEIVLAIPHNITETPT